MLPPFGKSDDDLHHIIAALARRRQRPKQLQFSPAQTACRPMWNQSHLVFRVLYPDFDKALQIRRLIEWGEKYLRNVQPWVQLKAAAAPVAPPNLDPQNGYV